MLVWENLGRRRPVAAHAVLFFSHEVLCVCVHMCECVCRVFLGGAMTIQTSCCISVNSLIIILSLPHALFPLLVPLKGSNGEKVQRQARKIGKWLLLSSFWPFSFKHMTILEHSLLQRIALQKKIFLVKIYGFSILLHLCCSLLWCFSLALYRGHLSIEQGSKTDVFP